MRSLYLIRHAKSSWENPGLRDFDRPLNQRGLHDAPKMARFLAEQGVKPDLLTSSPARRAFATALEFAQAFALDTGEINRNPEIYEASLSTILHLIRILPDSAKTVLFFGHNPGLTEAANHFIDHDFIDNIPTCGMVKISSDAISWSEFTRKNAKVVACYFPKEVL